MEISPVKASTVQRTVFNTDAIHWLTNTPVIAGSSLVTSLPDRSEFPKLSIEEWKSWFISAAGLALNFTPPEGVTIFYQSDIKVEGRWIDKAYLCQRAAENSGHSLLWHKIACRTAPGNSTFGRPGYSHMLCFSKDLKIDSRDGSTDILPDTGDKSWERGMGLNACMLIARFIMLETSTRILVSPFCGQGSMLAAANYFGLSAIGIERSQTRAHIARNLEVAGKIDQPDTWRWDMSKVDTSRPKTLAQ